VTQSERVINEPTIGLPHDLGSLYSITTASRS